MDLSELDLGSVETRAQGGDAGSQYELGRRYRSGKGVRRDFAAAADWFEKAACQEHAEAQLALGYMHELGEGCPANEAEAVHWYTRAAELGLAGAQFNLAQICDQNGRFDEAATWFRKAADQGIGKAQASLAFALSQGRGVRIDQIEALKYYHMAAEQGLAPAESSLGIIYAQGYGTPVNHAAALHWTRLAANQGFYIAEYTLGRMYEDGIALPADAGEALLWLLSASLKGHELARPAIERLRQAVSDTLWQATLTKVKWPGLSIVLGALADDHFPEVTQLRLKDDGSDDAVWLGYERKIADVLFLGPTASGGSILGMAFEEQVSVKKLQVRRACVGGETFGAVVIDFQDIRLANGDPVYWRPTHVALRSASAAIGLLGARKWVRIFYT